MTAGIPRCRYDSSNEATLSRPWGPVEQRFNGLQVTRTDSGAVTLVDGLAQFDTTIYREVAAGDHTIVLLQLHAVAHPARQTDASSPLVFHQSAFRRLHRPEIMRLG